MIVITQNALSSIFLIVFSGLIFWFGRDLGAGSLSVMGPAYIPYALASAILLIGLFIGARSLADPGEVVTAIRLRPVLLVSLAVLSFALLLERAGLLAAAAAAVLLSGLATSESRWPERLALAAGLAVFAALLFGVALGLPMKILP